MSRPELALWMVASADRNVGRIDRIEDFVPVGRIQEFLN